MPSQRVAVTFVVLLGSCCISAYPVHPESDSAHDFHLPDGAVDFVSESKPLAELQPSRNLHQALSALGEEAHGKGNKSTLQEDSPDRSVEDLHEVLWKMVAVGERQSQGFTQTEQAPGQPSKRACFWKYCVSK